MSLLHLNPKRLLIPGTNAPQLRYPDARGLIVPQPAQHSPVDYDTLTVHAQWQEYAGGDTDEVKYFCYDLTQIPPGGGEPDHYFKAVRLIRLTRVPRYLRTVSGGTGAHVFTQMRDVLVGLREKGILFCHIVAKTPQIPLIFAYGVQGLGDTLEEAKELADEAHAALTVNLDGTYQQLEYQPITASEGQLLSRYQNEWEHIAVARGRPMPQGVSLGSSATFDGNRTDVENTNNQLESFIRGMIDRSFMMTLITTPLTMDQMTLGWRNVTKHLSDVRSDTDGTRGFSAGFAVPLGMGTSHGDTSGTSHGLTDTATSGTSDSSGINASHAAGTSSSEGLNATNTTGHSDTLTQGVNHTDTTNSGIGQNTSLTDTSSSNDTQTASANHTLTDAQNMGTSTSDTLGRTDTSGTNASVGDSHSLATGQNFSQSHGVSAGSSIANSSMTGSNWSHGASQGMSAGQNIGSSWNQGSTDSLSQSSTFGGSTNHGTNLGNSTSDGSSFSGGLPGLSGGQNTSSGYNAGTSDGTGTNFGMSQTGGSANTHGVGGNYGTSYGTNQGISETAGGSISQGTTATNQVGTSDTSTAGQSLTATSGTNTSQGISNSSAFAATAGTGTNQGISTSSAAGVGASNAAGVGASNALSHGANVSAGTSAAQGTSASTAAGTSTSTATGTTSTEGVNQTNTAGTNSTTGTNTSQALADSSQVALSRQLMQSGTLGIVPTLSATVTKQTRDERKRMVGDLLQSKADRYMDGVEGGGMLYQLFLTTPDRPNLVAASSLMKNAFWGPGSRTHRLDSPFHTIIITDEEEAGRLRTHAAAFAAFLRREPTTSILEPYLYSTYVTTGEASTFCHPPTSEAPGLQTQADSMPVLAMPADRTHRQLQIGRIVNGERGRISELRFSVDTDELTHTLIQGITGLGKTTTMMTLLCQLAGASNTVVDYPDPTNPASAVSRELPASALVLDWMRNARKLANILPAERFALYSITEPQLGAFRFNPLQIPVYTMDPTEWLGAVSDQLSASFGLGDFGRNLISEQVDTLFSANRLEPFTLLEASVDPNTDQVIRPALVLPPVPEADLPAGAVQVGPDGTRYANVYSCPELSRLVGMPELATLVVARVQFAATVEGARAEGQAMRDRLQSLWRRLQNFAPGGPMAATLAADPDWNTRECLTVPDLVNPTTGQFTVLETDGLSMEGRRVVIGSVMLAVYRYALHHPNRPFDCGGKGPGTYIFLEEAHELFGAADGAETRTDAGHRAQLYESMFRRGRQTGLKLVALTQNCSQIPPGVVSQTTTLIAHATSDDNDKKTLMAQLNWTNMIGQQQREYRYLGEMPAGWAIVRMKPKNSYLEASPVQIVVDDPDLPDVDDHVLAALATARATQIRNARP